MRKIFIRIVAAGTIMGCAAPAISQIWIGQIAGDMVGQGQANAAEHACMTGTPLKEKKVEKERLPVAQRMISYHRSAQNGSAFLSNHFYPSKKSSWSYKDTQYGNKNFNSIADPYASEAMILDKEAIAYVRSGDGKRAQGQWIVRNANGDKIGTYNALMRRSKGEWKIQELQLVDADTYIDKVEQFCHEIGDVMPYRLESSKNHREWTERLIAKTEAKIEKHKIKMAETKAKLETSNRSSTKEKYKNQKQRMGKLEKTLALRQELVEKAKVEEAKAIADNIARETERAASEAVFAAS